MVVWCLLRESAFHCGWLWHWVVKSCCVYEGHILYVMTWTLSVKCEESPAVYLRNIDDISWERSRLSGIKELRSKLNVGYLLKMILTNMIYAVVFAFSGTLNINVMLKKTFGWSRLYMVHRSYKGETRKVCLVNPILMLQTCCHGLG